MKKLISIAFLLAATVTCVSASGLVHVKDYYRSDGTFVPSHYRTAPDGIKWNNFSY